MSSRPQQLKLVCLAAVACCIILLSVVVAEACDCLEPGSPKQELKRSTAVFSGKVTVIERKDRVNAVTINIARVWKGNPGAKATIQTAANVAACGNSFKIGSEYLFYCYAEGDDDKAVLATNICTRTRPLSEADEDLKDLGPGEQPPADARR